MKPHQIPDPFTNIRTLALHPTRGANFWSKRSVIRMDLDIGAYEEISSADVSIFTDQLVAAIPELVEHRCSIGTRGGFIERLRSGTYAAHIIEHVALALQELAGYDVGFGQTRGTGEPGCYTLVFEYVHEGVGLRAAALALEAVQRAFAGVLTSVDDMVAELRAVGTTETPAPVQQHVLCGITGSAGRHELRKGLLDRGIGGIVSDGEWIVDISPASLLHSGLSYAHSDMAVILDASPTDVPERYRDPARAAQLVAVVADAVPLHGIVICPADAHRVHDLVRENGRHVVKFVTADDVADRVRHAMIAVTTVVEHAHGHVE